MKKLDYFSVVVLLGFFVTFFVLIPYQYVKQPTSEPLYVPENNEKEVIQYPGFRITHGNGQVCGERPLRTRGGLRHVIGIYCVTSQGSFELNTTFLLPQHYDSLIEPMKTEVYIVAGNLGVQIW